MEKIISSVRREIFVKASPERIWAALTVVEERNKWETKNSQLDITIGGKVSLDYGWGVSYTGTVVELEENKKLVLQGENKEFTIWTITPQEQGSLVAIEYTGSWSGDIGLMEMENMLFGTYQFMLNLKSVFEENKDIRSNFWKSWIGVLHRSSIEGEIPGSKVVKVYPNTPADGFLQIGDVITEVNGEPLHSYDEIEKVISEFDSNQNIAIRVNRYGLLHSFSLETIPFGQSLK